MVIMTHNNKSANVVTCYCRKCGIEFEINLFKLVRDGCYCVNCRFEKHIEEKNVKNKIDE